MKKTFKILIGTVLAMSILFNAIACGDNINKKMPELKAADYEVWSAPSTVKIKQDEINYNQKGDLALDFNMVKNEYESNQLIITANKDIQSFYLTAADLTSGSNKISQDNVDIYYEKYVDTFANVDTTIYGRSFYPDALIPLSAAKKKGELSIKKDNNGALWITVYVPKDTVAGEYTGTFQLTLNNVKINVPVTVKVHDYTLTDEINAQSIFSWRYIRVGSGELDSSNAMMEYYYNYLLDYRIASQNLPIESLTPEETVAAAIKYYDKTPTYTLTTSLGDIASGLLSNKSVVTGQLLALAKASNAERNLLKKLVIYFIDEPNVSKEEVLTATINNIKALNAFLTDVVNAIENDNSGEYQNFKGIDNWQSYILDIPNIITAYVPAINAMIANQNQPKMQEYLQLLNTICPTFDNFNDDVREQMLSLFEEYNINIWWYGCSLPRAPYSTYHIADTNLLSARSISWLQKKYNVLGNLYWDVSAYTDELPSRYNEPIDVYTFPYRRSDTSFPAGDGFITYPGSAYDEYGPFPSLRLMSIRDGLEEYEMLLDIENNYKQLISEYGEDIDIDDVMERLYKPLYYSGTKLYADSENNLNFNQLRAELINTLFESKDDCGFVISSISTTDNISTVTYYVKDGYEVYIDGSIQTAVSGNKYVSSLDLRQSTSINFIIKQQGVVKYTYLKHIDTPIIILNNFDAYSSVPEGVTVTEQSTAFINTNSKYITAGKSLGFKVSSVFTGNEAEDIFFRPKITISTQIFETDVNFADLSTFVFDAYNSGESYNINIKLYSGNSYYDCGSYKVNHGYNQVSVSIANAKFSKMDSVDKIALEFSNSGDIDNPVQYSLFMDNLYAT